MTTGEVILFAGYGTAGWKDRHPQGFFIPPVSEVMFSDFPATDMRR